MITIIILLILAGVAVAALSGENGLLNQATKSVEESRKAGAKERIEVEVLGSYEINRKINMDMFRKNMEKSIPEATITGGSFPLTVTLDGYSYTVNENGKVKVKGEGEEDDRPDADVATSYVGYYADFQDEKGNPEPDGEIDGIIYADLAIGTNRHNKTMEWK